MLLFYFIIIILLGNPVPGFKIDAYGIGKFARLAAAARKRVCAFSVEGKLHLRYKRAATCGHFENRIKKC